MKFTYEALWKTLREKNLTFKTIAQDLKTSTLEFSPFIAEELAPKALVDILCNYLQCDLEEVVDVASIRFNLIPPKDLSEEDSIAVSLGARSAIRTRVEEGQRYEVLDVPPEECDLAVKGRFFIEDMDLFIDKAYTLYRGDRDNKDYGKEALDTLISEMENHRDDLLVIMAGYPDDMDYLMQGNSGLRSRIPYLIHFRNFTREELYMIFESLVKKHFKYDDEILPTAKEYFLSLDESTLSSKDFSNGRFVRNIFERTWAKAAMRRDLDNGTLRLAKEDFLLSVSDQELKKDLKDGRKIKRVGFGSLLS